VAFTVSSPIEENNGTAAESWLAPTDASAAPRHLLHRGVEVTNVAWTTGGRLSYSAAGRWSVDPANPDHTPRPEPEPEPAPAPAAERNLSPDGRWVASLRDRTPEEAPDTTAAVTPFQLRHQERFRGVQFDWLNFQRDGAAFPAPDPTAQPPREVTVTPVGGGEARTLTSLGMRPSGVVWHPGSGVLAFTADPDWKEERRYGRADVFLVTVDGRLARVTDDAWSYGSVAFSPDGRFLSWTGGFGTDTIIQQGLDHGGPQDLFLLPLEGGLPAAGALPVNLTAGWDLDPAGVHWSPDSRHLYFTAQQSGGTHLFRVGAQGGPVEPITSGERSHNGIEVDSAFTTMVYALGLFETPADLYAADIDGANERRLTDVNAGLRAEVALSRAERLLYPSYDGMPIEGWLLYPYGYDPGAGPYPLIVHSHGGPHSASGYGFDFKHQLFAAHGYFVLQANFRSSTGYGDAFKWATWGAWGDKDGEDVMAGIDYALAHFAIDRERVASIGHSYGGFMTNWLIARYPDRFIAAAAGAGIVNWVSDYGTADIARTKETEFFGTPWEPEARQRMIRQSPLSYADKVRAATLFVHGEVDQRVPYSEAEQMYVALKKNGVPAKVIVYEGQPHGIRGHWNAVHRMMSELGWFERWMKR
jgi:dipeptidyl aminopeptidase/acylaminoacyl peptidase